MEGGRERNIYSCLLRPKLADETIGYNEIDEREREREREGSDLDNEKIDSHNRCQRRA